jgi:hypothetical protein
MAKMLTPAEATLLRFNLGSNMDQYGPMARLLALKRLREFDAAQAGPKAAPAPKPKPAPAQVVTPLPVAVPTQPAGPAPGQDGASPPIAQAPLPVGAQGTIDTPPTIPQIDDARDRVDASQPAPTPTGPDAVVPDPRKRKRYGLASTILTGETGLGNLGGIARRNLLG